VIPTGIETSFNLRRMALLAGLSQIACSTSATGCNRATNEKILLEETEQGSDPPAKACPYQSKLDAPSLPKQGQKLSHFFDGLPDCFTVALQI